MQRTDVQASLKLHSSLETQVPKYATVLLNIFYILSELLITQNFLWSETFNLHLITNKVYSEGEVQYNTWKSNVALTTIFYNIT